MFCIDAILIPFRHWSSYRGYAGLEKKKSFLDSEPIQGVFLTYIGRRWKAWEYRRWVQEGLIGEMEDPFQAAKWQQILGGEGFLRKLKDHWNQRAERPENYGQQRNWSAVGAEQVLELVSEHFQFNLEALKERGIRGNLARRCAITLCWDHAGLSHDEIAALFRMPSSKSAGRTVRRTTAHDAQTLKVSHEWEDKNVLKPFTALTPSELCDGLKIAVLAIYAFRYRRSRLRC
jgi:hypothetical protein